MRTLLEFGIKYSKQKSPVKINCELKTATKKKDDAPYTYFIQFSLILVKNDSVNLEPVELLLQPQKDEAKND